MVDRDISSSVITQSASFMQWEVISIATSDRHQPTDKTAAISSVLLLSARYVAKGGSVVLQPRTGHISNNAVQTLLIYMGSSSYQLAVDDIRQVLQLVWPYAGDTRGWH